MNLLSIKRVIFSFLNISRERVLIYHHNEEQHHSDNKDVVKTRQIHTGVQRYQFCHF